VRLGELLVAVNALTSDQVTEALRAQVLYGGRLGTNLIELGIMEVEPLSTVLANLQHRPAALGKHFENPDRDLQQSFAAHLAQRYACIPLIRAGTSRVIVASISPLDEQALTEIAADLELPPGRIVSTVAPELRIRYYLERVYDIPREARFLRVRGKVSRTILKSELHAVDVELDDARRSLAELDVPIAPAMSPPPAATMSMTHEIALAPPGLTPPEERATEKLGPRDWLVPDAPAPSATAAIMSMTNKIALAPPGLAPPEHRATEKLGPREWIAPDPTAPSATEPLRDRAAASSRPPATEVLRDRAAPSSRPPATKPPATAPPRDWRPPSRPPKTELVRERAVSSSRPPVKDSARISEVADEAIAAAQALLDAVTASPTLRNIETGERRTYLPTLADEKPREVRPTRESRRLERAPGSQSFISIGDATLALRRCHDREQLAQLAIKAVMTLGPSEAAILLSIRGNAAVGWTGFGRQPIVLPEIVVPLDQPGLIATAVRGRACARAASKTLGTIDARLFELLGGPRGDLVAVPVTVANDVICVFAIVAAHNAEVTNFETIAAASGTAFLRLLRNSNR
jgi:hypothetical protein